MKTILVPLSLLGFLAGGFPLNAQEEAATPTTPVVLNERTTLRPPVPTGDIQRNANQTAQSPPVPTAGDPLYAPVATSFGPQSLHEKFMNYAIITFGPRAVFTPVFSAAIRMTRPRNAYPRDWRLGVGAFGRNYGNALASRASMETGRFLTGAVLHEDFRYRPSRSKNPLARSSHALAFTFVDKSDSGHNRIALANLVGASVGGFVGNLYLPAGFNNISHAETRTAIEFGAFAAQNLLREFAPELLKGTHKLHLPFPRIPVPEWWVNR